MTMVLWLDEAEEEEEEELESSKHRVYFPRYALLFIHNNLSICGDHPRPSVAVTAAAATASATAPATSGPSCPPLLLAETLRFHLPVYLWSACSGWNGTPNRKHIAEHA